MRACACVFARAKRVCICVYACMCECVRAWGREGKRGEGRGVSAVYITAHLLEDVYVLEETLEKERKKAETADGEMLHIKLKKLHVTGAGRRLQRVQQEPGVEDG